MTDRHWHRGNCCTMWDRYTVSHYVAKITDVINGDRHRYHYSEGTSHICVVNDTFRSSLIDTALIIVASETLSEVIP